MKNTVLKTKALPTIALIYASLVWGSTFFMVKGALSSIHPITLVAYRFCFAAVLLCPVLVYFKKPLWKNFQHGIWLGVILWIALVTQTIGLQYTSATNSGFITALFVVIVPFFGFITRRAIPRPLQLLAILLTVIGLWLLTGGVSGLNRGDLLTLTCAFASAMHILTADRSMKVCDPLVLCFQQFVVTGVASLLTALCLGLPLSVDSVSIGWFIVFLVLFPTLSGFLIQLWAQKKLEPLKVSMILSSEPLFATFFACTLGQEVFSLQAGLGGLFLFAAMLVSEMQTSKPREPVTEAA